MFVREAEAKQALAENAVHARRALRCVRACGRVAFASRSAGGHTLQLALKLNCVLSAARVLPTTRNGGDTEQITTIWAQAVQAAPRRHCLLDPVGAPWGDDLNLGPRPPRGDQRKWVRGYVA
eukprot:CAMPEP_0176240896 /NCGR_PEP_ID=MMETSP0121_2-20121125/29610_1 /TAXON_ID=160619 /ORGANISM="Kryptoperidinium foliaceum, Strain CCMP 1326" /LENGTH=121 /DNA_ID=CAMNT_0017580403 /DNA_START=45 /DNA_END=406 /DNA_ORIENTATION=-